MPVALPVALPVVLAILSMLCAGPFSCQTVLPAFDMYCIAIKPVL